jgi:CarboxypepD_reg-like domain/TonB-dependent Receptor Plug Domain
MTIFAENKSGFTGCNLLFVINRIAGIFFFSFLILPSEILFSQEQRTTGKFTLSGFVKEEATGESSIGASIYLQNKEDEAKRQGITTNQYGFYSITLEQGKYSLSVSYIGFENYTQEISLDRDIRMNVQLKEIGVVTKEVEILGKKPDENIKSTDMGVMTLDIEKIKQLPSFMGETDILKTIQLLPGVQSAGEGNSGFYVRGGGPDQNLVLLDEAVVYNTAHLFGFFSVFNGDAIKNVELIKGNMPAQYGGRLSSVLDISMKDGNSQKFHGEGGIGLIASRLTVEGPIKKDTCSYIVSARRTYADVLARPFVKSAFKGSGYYFYDLNTKINYRISDKDRLFFSAYFGRDVFVYNNSRNPGSSFKADFLWGNATTTLRWNHLLSRKLFVNTSAIFSNYKFEFGATQSQFEFRLYSGIRDWNGKLDFSYFPSAKHKIKFGTNYIYHTFTPSHASAKSGDVVFNVGGIIKLYAHDAAFYVSDDFELSARIKLNAGLRYSYFRQVGPFKRYLKSGVGQKIVDTIVYRNGDKIAEYGGPEPRASVRIELSRTSSIKLGFAQNYQYIHLASISSVALPTDVWMPSTSVIKPQFSTQYAVGFFKNFKEDVFETSVEVYYKDMRHLLDYKEGSLPDDNVNDNVDNAFTFGHGWSYGAEFFLKKRTGKFNGWIGYSLCWTWRQFDSINLGEKFLAKYDRRNDVSLALTYDLNKFWTFGSVFVFATGNNATLPVSWYFIEGQITPEYGKRNAYRMAPYHRLDISATYTPDKAKKRARKRQLWEDNMKKKGIDTQGLKKPDKWYTNMQGSWNFSVYNAYNRHNPFFIYFEKEGNIFEGSLNVKAMQVSLFPILPSVTWNFRF